MIMIQLISSNGNNDSNDNDNNNNDNRCPLKCSQPGGACAIVITEVSMNPWPQTQTFSYEYLS